MAADALQALCRHKYHLKYLDCQHFTDCADTDRDLTVHAVPGALFLRSHAWHSNCQVQTAATATGHNSS